MQLLKGSHILHIHHQVWHHFFQFFEHCSPFFIVAPKHGLNFGLNLCQATARFSTEEMPGMIILSSNRICSKLRMWLMVGLPWAQLHGSSALSSFFRMSACSFWDKAVPIMMLFCCIKELLVDRIKNTNNTKWYLINSHSACSWCKHSYTFWESNNRWSNHSIFNPTAYSAASESSHSIAHVQPASICSSSESCNMAMGCAAICAEHCT